MEQLLWRGSWRGCRSRSESRCGVAAMVRCGHRERIVVM